MTGSSPLARGTCAPVLEWRAWNRLIPARAGNIWMSRLLVSSSSAHPRSRGEHPLPRPSAMAASGSSPLARGTCRRQTRQLQLQRLIPARAGNIPPARSLTLEPSAHPRSRGEHVVVFPDFGSGGGSSPLARGTSDSSHPHTAAVRLIPARAGNIGGHQSFAWSMAAHPRSRGEHTC